MKTEGKEHFSLIAISFDRENLACYNSKAPKREQARVAESADATDLKSVGLTPVPVQVRSRAPVIISRSGAVGSSPGS